MIDKLGGLNPFIEASSKSPQLARARNHPSFEKTLQEMSKDCQVNALPSYLPYVFSFYPKIAEKALGICLAIPDDPESQHNLQNVLVDWLRKGIISATLEENRVCLGTTYYFGSFLENRCEEEFPKRGLFSKLIDQLRNIDPLWNNILSDSLPLMERSDRLGAALFIGMRARNSGFFADILQDGRAWNVAASAPGGVYSILSKIAVIRAETPEIQDLVTQDYLRIKSDFEKNAGGGQLIDKESRTIDIDYLSGQLLDVMRPYEKDIIYFYDTLTDLRAEYIKHTRREP